MTRSNYEKTWCHQLHWLGLFAISIVWAGCSAGSGKKADVEQDITIDRGFTEQYEVADIPTDSETGAEVTSEDVPNDELADIQTDDLPELPACTHIGPQDSQETTFDLVYPEHFVREASITKNDADMFVDFGDGQTWHLGFNRGTNCVEMLFGGPNFSTTCFHNSDNSTGTTQTLTANWGGPTYGTIAGFQRDVDRQCSFGGYYGLTASLESVTPEDTDQVLVEEFLTLLLGYVALFDHPSGGLMAYWGLEGTQAQTVSYSSSDSTFSISGTAEYDAGGGDTYNASLSITDLTIDPATGAMQGDFRLSVQVSGTSPLSLSTTGGVVGSRN